MSFLVFVSKPTGYELREQDGDPPAVGTELELDGTHVQVTKVAPSPFPGDERPCAFTQPA